MKSNIVEAAWNMATPVLDIWQTMPTQNFPNYPAPHAWGLLQAEALLRRDGQAWRQLKPVC